MKKILIFILWLVSINAYAGKILTGIGYLAPEKYRVDNEINTLPFGWSVVPFIGYRSERFSIVGPRIRYSLLRGMFGAALHLEPSGDRYRSEEVKEKDSGINFAASVRLLFLSVKYGSDIYDKYNGNKLNVTVAHRFVPTDSIFIIPRVGYEYLNQSYTNYYFGVKSDEVGTYSEYELGGARNTVGGLTVRLQIDNSNSFSVNYNYREFDKDIYDSPTVKLRQYNSYAVFWTIALN